MIVLTTIHRRRSFSNNSFIHQRIIAKIFQCPWFQSYHNIPQQSQQQTANQYIAYKPNTFHSKFFLCFRIFAIPPYTGHIKNKKNHHRKHVVFQGVDPCLKSRIVHDNTRHKRKDKKPNYRNHYPSKADVLPQISSSRIAKHQSHQTDTQSNHQNLLPQPQPWNMYF